MRSIWRSLIISLFPVALFAQEVPQHSKIGVQVNLVSLDVEVLDRDDNHVWGLTDSEFIVEENGVAMEITNFAVYMDHPVSMVAVLDTSALSVEQLIVCKAFLRAMAQDLDHTDELCLYSFDSDDVYLEQDYTSEMKHIWDALDNIGVPSRQRSGLLLALFGEDPPTGLAIDMALLKLKKARNSKKALVLISNRFNDTGPVTVERIQESDCTFMTLAFSHKASRILKIFESISTNQLMRESGGRRFSAESPDIEEVCRRMLYSLKNYYSIGYITDIQPEDRKPRKVQVRLPRHSHKINFRRTYVPAAEQQ